jgi:two-component system, cell cycle sensor histidine kinase and response regulator CckA
MPEGNMAHDSMVRILLIEDDEDDFILAQSLLAEIRGSTFEVSWAQTYEEGLEKLLLNHQDICLLDYRLGARNGIDLLKAAAERKCESPVILLTGLGEHAVDLEAMQAGAADYLVKSELRADSLGRSIRYALQRKRAAATAAADQARLAEFGADVGRAVAGREPLDVLLGRCARAMAKHLNAGLAAISTFDLEQKEMTARAIAGPLAEGIESPYKAPALKLDVDALVAAGPLVLNNLQDGCRLKDPDWFKRHGVRACAAYPLVIEDQLAGLMSLFSQQPLSERVLQEMSSVAGGIALCIHRKQSQEALDRSEVKYRTVVESIKEVIFQLDELGKWVMLNSAWTAVSGFEVKATLSTLFLDHIFQEDKGHNQRIFQNLIERRQGSCRYETRLRTLSGQVRWVEIYLQTLLDTDGSLLGVSGSLSDIHDRKVADIQIQKLAAFPRVNPNPVLEFSADAALTYVNEAARDLARELGQEDVLAILPGQTNQIVQQCLAGNQSNLRQEVSIANRILSWSFFPISTSRVVHCYGADVTEMLNLEAQLRHAQKLESVGQLAAGIAHDFNNLLTVIQGYAECLLAQGSEDSFTATALKQISMASHRAAGLTRQLLTFSRKQVLQPEILDLNAVLKNLVKMIGRVVGEHIQVENQYASSLPCIEADTGMIEQVAMNLVVNSRDAMPNGGTLRIATTAAEFDAEQVSRNPQARPGSFVCLTVSDTGCGMDAKTLERIFEPFFTTKAIGKGTGLGLATVYGIVKQHKGWLDVTSQPGQGTTFKMFFPAASAEARSLPAADQASPEISYGRCETVLVVEDDPVLREFVREVLTQRKYRVVEAASGAEALQVWERMQSQVDLLLTDMVMPNGVSGWELAKQLRKRRSDLKVIFSSGYSEEVIGNEFELERAWFLPKPYNPQKLAQMVRQCLEPPPSQPDQKPPLAPATENPDLPDQRHAGCGGTSAPQVLAPCRT